jgi:nitrate/nitrite transporter NarK
MVSDEEQFRWSDLKTFNMSFWIICINCVMMYGGIFPFIQVASDLLQKVYMFSSTTSGSMFGIPYYISACTSPFLGFMVDKIGKRALIGIVAGLLLTAGHIMTAFGQPCD